MARKNNTKKLNKFANQFIKSLEVASRQTKRPIVVAMIGHVGSGKSSVAKVIAKPIRATVINADNIRLFLRKHNEDYKLVRSIAKKSLLYVLKQNGNVVFDSDFIVTEKRRELREAIKKFKANLFYVRTFADGDTVIDRLVKAKYNKSSFFKSSTIAIREMWRRTPHHYRWTKDRGGQFILRKLRISSLIEVDTGKKWNAKVQNLVNRIKQS